MAKVKASGFTISIDGFGAGADQTDKHPLGIGGEQLHKWMITTRSFKQMHGGSGGSDGIDDSYVARGNANVGAWIMGRNMFAPSRGPWPDDGWRGWWGDDPPYHAPVFVLTHHAHQPIKMAGGTTFYFVTDGIHAALDRAREAAGAADVRIIGGVATIREHLQARLIDELHLAISPIVLGSGERLFDGIDAKALGYKCTEHTASEHATHLVLTRK
ncbi:MAG: dihydrofolate reductase family protein [Kofleriaceae bacterium]